MNVRDKDDGLRCWCMSSPKRARATAPAEASDDRYHGVNKFDVATGQQIKPKANAPSYTQRLRQKPRRRGRARRKKSSPSPPLCGRHRPRLFGKAFPERTFDVAIANNTPSLSRRVSPPRAISPSARFIRHSCSAAMNQVVHDVAVQGLPVRFAIDRAGLVGADGPTHAGAFDLAYLGCLPAWSSWRGRRGRN